VGCGQSGILYLGGAGDYSLAKNVQSGFLAHPAYYSMGIRVLSWWGKVPVPPYSARLRMSGAIHLLPNMPS